MKLSHVCAIRCVAYCVTQMYTTMVIITLMLKLYTHLPYLLHIFYIYSDTFNAIVVCFQPAASPRVTTRVTTRLCGNHGDQGHSDEGQESDEGYGNEGHEGDEG